MKFLRRKGRSQEDAEDLIQEAMLRLHVYGREAPVANEEAFLRQAPDCHGIHTRRRCRGPAAPRPHQSVAGWRQPTDTRDMLDHLNRRYGGNFITDNFRYRSHYNSRMRRNEVCIESLVDQTVTLAALGVTVSFRASELIDAEVMWKFDPEELAAVLDRAGFSMVRRWIEPTHRYGLFLLRHK
jgi:hypothetical protein